MPRPPPQAKPKEKPPAEPPKRPPQAKAQEVDPFLEGGHWRERDPSTWELEAPEAAAARDYDAVDAVANHGAMPDGCGSGVADAPADVWSLGMVLHVMLCGCFPFTTSGVDEEGVRQ